MFSNSISIQFDLSHSSISTGEAYFSTVAFYLPKYLKLMSNCNLGNTLNESAIFFSVNYCLIFY